eukprot:1292212-Rhodomonas_salina.2
MARAIPGEVGGGFIAGEIAAEQREWVSAASCRAVWVRAVRWWTDLQSLVLRYVQSGAKSLVLRTVRPSTEARVVGGRRPRPSTAAADGLDRRRTAEQ